jgi:RNA polymerase sigma-70 factor, ECF subfamily
MASPEPAPAIRQRVTPELIAACRRGDPRSFEEVVRRTHRQVYTQALRLVGDRKDAEDVAQDAYFRMFRALKGFRGDAQFETWLYRIVANAAMSHLRRRRRFGDVLAEPEDAPLPEIASPAKTDDQAVDRRMLEEAMDALPSDERTLVRFGRGWGRSWATRRKRELNGSSPRSRRARAELLARELRDWGWRPTATREGSRVRLTTGQCLFRDVIGANTNGRCCALEEGLLSGLVEALANGHARVDRAEGCDLSVVV